MGENKGIDWSLVSEVKASDRRTQVLQALSDKPQMNSDLADSLGISTKWARRQVKWLEKRGLVKDLTEEKHNYKLYSATEEGKQVVEYLSLFGPTLNGEKGSKGLLSWMKRPFSRPTGQLLFTVTLTSSVSNLSRQKFCLSLGRDRWYLNLLPQSAVNGGILFRAHIHQYIG